MKFSFKMVVVLIVSFVACIVYCCSPNGAFASMSDEDFIKYLQKTPFGSKDVNEAVKNGANVNAKNTWDETALMFLVKNRSSGVELVKFFIESGADVNAKDVHGKTPLMYAAENNPDVDVIKALMEGKSFLFFFNSGGADVNAKTNDGTTALMFALANPNPEVIPVIIRAGADVNAKDKKGNTPLSLAKNKDSRVQNALINAGAQESKLSMFDMILCFIAFICIFAGPPGWIITFAILYFVFG